MRGVRVAILKKSWNILRAFPLRPLIQKATIRRIHICGEAYSDYQAFIEGALSSASKVLMGRPFRIEPETFIKDSKQLPRTTKIWETPQS